jgi:hypothetical protein
MKNEAILCIGLTVLQWFCSMRACIVFPRNGAFRLYFDPRRTFPGVARAILRWRELVKKPTNVLNISPH